MSDNQTVWLTVYAAVLAAMWHPNNTTSADKAQETATLEANKAVETFQQVNP